MAIRLRSSDAQELRQSWLRALDDRTVQALPLLSCNWYVVEAGIVFELVLCLSWYGVETGMVLQLVSGWCYFVKAAAATDCAKEMRKG